MKRKNDHPLSVFGFQFSDISLPVISQLAFRTDKQKSDNRKLVFCIGIFVLFIPFLITPVVAQSKSGTLEVNPAYVEVLLEKPQEEKVVEITYTNNSQKPFSLELFPIDFKQQSETGGISFIGKDAAQSYSYSLSSFLTFESTSVDIDPGERRRVLITITNRQDISPGGHYAAVVAREVKDAGDSTNTTVSPAISSLIFMRKTGGERFSLSVQGLDWPRFPVVFSLPLNVHVTFQNEGNIHVVPYGRADITDMFGRLVYKGIVNNSSAIVFPETRRIIPMTLKKIDTVLPFAFMSLSLKGSDSLQKVSYIHQESFLYINPWVGVGVIFLIGIAIIVSKRKKKKR